MGEYCTALYKCNPFTISIFMSMPLLVYQIFHDVYISLSIMFAFMYDIYVQDSCPTFPLILSCVQSTDRKVRPPLVDACSDALSQINAALI